MLFRSQEGDDVINAMTMRFYWDVYLVLNFIMNLFLIGMTALLRRKYLKKRCLVVAAFLGSSQETLFVLLWLRYCVGKAGEMQKMYQPGVFLLVVALLTALEMLQITFHEKQLRELLKDIFAMLQVSLATGGMIYMCREWICRWRSPGIWMVFAGAAGVFFVLFVMERYLRHGEKRVNTMDGIIGLEDGRRYPLRLLLDTGNCLVSPYSGERVMIMAQSLALKLKIAEQKRPLMIPYHSIGGDGVLPAYRIPLLILQDGSVIRNFLAAVSPQLSEDSAVQLIMYGRR